MGKWSRFILVPVLAALVAAACGSAGTPAPAGGGASSSASGGKAPATTGTIRFGVISCVDMCGWEMMADAQGFWKAAGLNVEFTQNDSSTTLLKALLAGSLDVIDIAPPESLTAASQGGKVKIVGAPIPGTAFDIYASDKIKSLKDLEGKTVGTSQIGASPYMMVLAAMEQAGLDPKTLKWVNAGGNAERFKALLVGKIDAAPAPSVFEQQLKTNPGFHVLVNVGTQIPQYIRVTSVTSDAVIASKRALLQEFITGYSQGLRYAASHEDAFVQLSQKVAGSHQTADQFKQEWTDWSKEKLFAPDLAVSSDAINFLQKLNVEVGHQKSVLPLNQVVDTSFQQAALKQLGPWSWPSS